jgi:CheY-like chemotaxis protein
MYRVRLIHWNDAEAKERVAQLYALGFEAFHAQPQGRGFRKDLGNDLPDAVVIDLFRLPSQGRDLAVMIRKQKSTRYIPLVFAGGAAQKVARVKALLPDALYTTWEHVGDALEEAISNPPSEPVAPDSAFAAYAGKPLVEKLGIKTNTTLGLVYPPEGFMETLGVLPHGVEVREGIISDCDISIWFTRSQDELINGIEATTTSLDRGPIWIAWPKKASGVVTDLSQQIVRQAGLNAGLVDYKICSIDKTWSGLLFSKRGTRK